MNFDWLRMPVVKLPTAVTRTLPGQLLEMGLRYAPTTQGRASRTELLATVMLVVVLGIVLGIILPEDTGAVFGPEDRRSGWFDLAFAILLALPVFSVIIRRLHDVDRRWWAIFTCAIPYVGIFVLLTLLFWNGNPEENLFGAPPDTR